MEGPAGATQPPAAPSAPLPRGAAPVGTVHSLRSLGQGSLLSLIGQIFLVGALFGVRVLMVRDLSTASWSALVIALAFVGLVGAFGALGLQQAVARQLAHTVETRRRRDLVVNSLLLSLPAAGIASAAMFLAARPLAPYLGGAAIVPALEFFAGYLAVTTVSGLLAAFFQGNEDVIPNTLFNQVLNPALALIFLVIFLQEGLGLTGALLAYLLSALAALVGLLVYTLSPRGRPWNHPLDPRRVQGQDYPTDTPAALLKFSLPLAVVAIATATVGTADTLILGALSPDPLNAVAAYGAVLPMARLVGLGAASLGYIMLPVASHLHRVGDMEELRRSYTTITKWILLVSLPFFLLFFFLPTPSLALVIGAKVSNPTYAQAPLLLQVTVLGMFLATLTGPASAVLIGLGKLRLLLYDTVASAVTDVLLSAALVPFVGALGAAIAFASATALLPVLCVTQTQLLERIHPFHSVLVRPLLSVTVPVGALLLWISYMGWPLPGLWLPGLFGVLFLGYLVAIPATRSLETEDGHLLDMFESYLGRRLDLIRRLGSRFVGRTREGP